MGLLFINACFRDGSRTLRLAHEIMKGTQLPITEVDLGENAPLPLDRERLRIYNSAVEAHTFTHDMFNDAKQFRDAEEIVIAAPFWNMGIPAILHSYLEMVCTQGITFDLIEGEYKSLCHAKRLTYITTSGGYIPENDHAYGFIRTLAQFFFGISDIRYVKAEGLDIYGADVEKILADALK